MTKGSGPQIPTPFLYLITLNKLLLPPCNQYYQFNSRSVGIVLPNLHVYYFSYLA